MIKYQDVPPHFIHHIIIDDLKSNKWGQRVATRFPPEPNGFLHIGHAKSICLNFGITEHFQGSTCNLRFDDTNPTKEEQAYIDAIQEDVKWLGFNWNGEVRYASDYFDELYELAIKLIKMGKAFVCDLSQEEMRQYRGTLTEPGKESPYRNRTVEENLDLFQRMKNGEFAEGSRVLRAKIDMSAGNINMRDPVIYRILKAHHPRTGDKWCIYPMYDYTHCISDAIEGITHSLCTLEFQDHRPLYDWCIDELKYPHHPQQIEFARLNVNYTVTSKRKLKALVDQKKVSGWDDPRMPTISGLRRRGYTPESLRKFCEQIGVSKKENVIDMGVLEEALRDDLNTCALRAFAVLKPLKVIITNYPEGQVETLSVPNHPQRPELGRRELPFAREIFIEQEDFMENPPADYFRLSPGKEVRLRYSYIIRCDKVVKDETGNVVTIEATYDQNTLGKNPEGRKVKGIIHWVPAKQSVRAEVRLYDRLFNVENPGAQDDFTYGLNPESLDIISDAYLEPSLASAKIAEPFQFERLGYFSKDQASSQDKLIFNRSVTLRDTWKSS